MAGANPPYASTRSGKPINVADQVSVVATVTSISGTGPAAVLTLRTDSGDSVNVAASNVYAAQTL